MRTKEDRDKRATGIALRLLEKVGAEFKGATFPEPAAYDCKPLVQCQVQYHDYGNISDDELENPEGMKIPQQIDRMARNFAARVGDISRPLKLNDYGGVDSCFHVVDGISNIDARVLRIYDLEADEPVVSIDVAFV